MWSDTTHDVCKPTGEYRSQRSNVFPCQSLKRSFRVSCALIIRPINCPQWDQFNSAPLKTFTFSSLLPFPLTMNTSQINCVLYVFPSETTHKENWMRVSLLHPSFGGTGVYAHINFLFNLLQIFTSFITDHTSLPQLWYAKTSLIFSFLDQQQLLLYTRHGVVKTISQGKENSAFRTTTEHSNDPVQFQWVECRPGKHQDKKESLKLTILPWRLSPNPLTSFYKTAQEGFHLRKLKWVFNDSQDLLEGFTAEISQYIIYLNYPQSSKDWSKKEVPWARSQWLLLHDPPLRLFLLFYHSGKDGFNVVAYKNSGGFCQTSGQ